MRTLFKLTAWICLTLPSAEAQYNEKPSYFEFPSMLHLYDIYADFVLTATHYAATISQYMPARVNRILSKVVFVLLF